MVEQDAQRWRITWPEVHADADVLPAVDAGLRDIWEYALSEAKRHRKSRKLMARLVYDLGIPAAVLAAIAGATAAAEIPAWITTVVALSASALSAAVAVIGPVEGRIDHGRKKAEWSHLARRVYTTRLRLSAASPNKQIAALDVLGDDRFHLDLRAPIRGGTSAQIENEAGMGSDGDDQATDS